MKQLLIELPALTEFNQQSLVQYQIITSKTKQQTGQAKFSELCKKHPDCAFHLQLADEDYVYTSTANPNLRGKQLATLVRAHVQSMTIADFSQYAVAFQVDPQQLHLVWALHEKVKQLCQLLNTLKCQQYCVLAQPETVNKALVLFSEKPAKKLINLRQLSITSLVLCCLLGILWVQQQRIVAQVEQQNLTNLKLLVGNAAIDPNNIPPLLNRINSQLNLIQNQDPALELLLLAQTQLPEANDNIKRLLLTADKLQIELMRNNVALKKVQELSRQNISIGQISHDLIRY